VLRCGCCTAVQLLYSANQHVELRAFELFDSYLTRRVQNMRAMSQVGGHRRVGVLGASRQHWHRPDAALAALRLLAALAGVLGPAVAAAADRRGEDRTAGAPLRLLLCRWIISAAHRQPCTASLLTVMSISKHSSGERLWGGPHDGSVTSPEHNRTLARLGEEWLCATAGLLLLQGVATSVYAATAPELEGHSGAYLENCRIKKPSTTGRDPQQAARLWAVTEEQIAAADSPGGFKP